MFFDCGNWPVTGRSHILLSSCMHITAALTACILICRPPGSQLPWYTRNRGACQPVVASSSHRRVCGLAWMWYNRRASAWFGAQDSRAHGTSCHATRLLSAGNRLHRRRGVYRGRITQKTSLEQAPGQPPRTPQGEDSPTRHLQAVWARSSGAPRLPQLRHVSRQASARYQDWASQR